MTYNEVLDYIFSLKTVSLNPTLERITAALKLLSNPQDHLNVIHIAGTNGKGSVASMVSEILKASGKKVGLFISPFIIDFCERIQINGKFISETDLTRLTEKVIAVQEKLKPQGLELGQFEFITVVAMLYFKEQLCDYVVLETGLGGRYDATNVCKKPLCTVITKISLDHTAVLGDTIQQITWEKAGIIKQGVPCITCAQCPESLNILKSTCENLGAELIEAKPVGGININLTGTEFRYKENDYFTSLLGAHQAENATLAIEAAITADNSISYGAIKQGLSKVKHPARMEVFSGPHPIIIDGAHNPDGASALAAFLKSVKFYGNLIFGGMRDKNTEEVARILAPYAKKIVTVIVENNPRSETADKLKAIFDKYNKNVIAANNYNDALHLTSENATVICGSLYLAADMRKHLYKTI